MAIAAVNLLESFPCISLRKTCLLKLFLYNNSGKRNVKRGNIRISVSAVLPFCLFYFLACSRGPFIAVSLILSQKKRKPGPEYNTHRFSFIPIPVPSRCGQCETSCHQLRPLSGCVLSTETSRDGFPALPSNYTAYVVVLTKYCLNGSNSTTAFGLYQAI